MRYTIDNPKWVEGTDVEYSTDFGTLVNVTALGQRFTNCELRWDDPEPFPDKTKSNVLVQNSEGDWLCIWFFDESIKDNQVR